MVCAYCIYNFIHTPLHEKSVQFSSVISGWSVDGLTTHHGNGSTVVNCSSQHLTSFAVLVNAAGTKVRVNRNSQLYFQKDPHIHV